MEVIVRADGQIKQWKRIPLNDMLPSVRLCCIEGTCALTKEVKSWNIEPTKDGFIVHNMPRWFHSWMILDPLRYSCE